MAIGTRRGACASRRPFEAMYGADMLLIAVAMPHGEDGAAAILAERVALLGERAVSPETGQSKGAWRKPSG